VRTKIWQRPWRVTDDAAHRHVRRLRLDGHTVVVDEDEGGIVDLTEEDGNQAWAERVRARKARLDDDLVQTVLRAEMRAARRD
jgi:hypothetical protein